MAKLIPRTRNNVIHAGNGREVNLPRVPNLKVDGYCAETKYFSISGAFGMGVFTCPIDKLPSVRLKKLCRTGMRKLKRGCRKSRPTVIRLFSILG